MKDVQFDIQEEFIELTNSSSDKDIHETQDLVTFSIYILACNAQQLSSTNMLCFASTVAILLNVFM